MRSLKRVVIKEELVDLTGDYMSALIINQFVYWTQRMFDTDKFLVEEKARAHKHDIEMNIDLQDGWIYKTTEDLIDELMLNLSPSTLRRNIKPLVEKGFLAERRNPKYKWDKTLQYRVNLVKIQTELAKLGYSLEGFSLLPGITVTDNRLEAIEQAAREEKERINEEAIAIMESKSKELEIKLEKEATIKKQRIARKEEVKKVLKDSPELIIKNDIDSQKEHASDEMPNNNIQSALKTNTEPRNNILEVQQASNKEYRITDLQNNKDYIEILNKKIQENPNFVNYNKSGQDMVISNELKKRGYNIIY